MNSTKNCNPEVIIDDVQILDYPRLRGFIRNLTEWSFTLTFWAFWIYLLLPLINLLVWVLVGKTIFSTVIAQSGYLELLDIIRKWGIATLVTITFFTGWAYYNYWMFGKKNRRKLAIDCLEEELADFFHISTDTIKCIKSTRKMEIVVKDPKTPGIVMRLDSGPPSVC